MSPSSPLSQALSLLPLSALMLQEEWSFLAGLLALDAALLVLLPGGL